MLNDIHRLVLDAEKRIRRHIRLTPLEPSVDLGRESGGPVFLKLENIQHTGSFKVRGALNRLLVLDDEEKKAGVVTASSGNHGMATVFGLNRVGIDVGCLPAHSPAMSESVRAGRILDVQTTDTLSDGTAGGIEPGAITFDPCRMLVDDRVLVSEEEIRNAMVRVFDNHRLVIEGAAGVAVAGFLKMAPQLAGKKVALVVCGGNIDVGVFRQLICSSY